MGCCESTPIAKNPYVSPPNNQNPPPPKSDITGRAQPPPPVLEEETVKEVLSETPISKQPPPAPTVPPPEITTTTKNDNTNPNVQINKTEPIDLTKPTEREISIVSEISDASELCSFSGSFSTTTLNDKDDGEVTQRLVPRSPAKTRRKCTYSGEIPRRNERGPRSPARVSAPSPSKRGQVVRSRPAQGRTTTTPHRRNVGPSNGFRKDPGEASLRRSRSPAPRGENVGPGGRSGGHKVPTSSSMTGQSGCRSPVRKVEEGQKLEKQDDDVSLENPLVSLECFIFL